MVAQIWQTSAVPGQCGEVAKVGHRSDPRLMCKVVSSVKEVGIGCRHDDQIGHLNEQQGIEHPLRHNAAVTASGTLG